MSQCNGADVCPLALCELHLCAKTQSSIDESQLPLAQRQMSGVKLRHKQAAHVRGYAQTHTITKKL